MEGLLYCFQEQTDENTEAVLNAFGSIVNSLGFRVKAWIPQICGLIQWTLHNRSPMVR